jgi:hypothetical protein
VVDLFVYLRRLKKERQDRVSQIHSAFFFLQRWEESSLEIEMIRLTIVLPRWMWWLALRCRVAISLEVDGETLAPYDLVKHGRPLTLLYVRPQSGSPVERSAVATSPVG